MPATLGCGAHVGDRAANRQDLRGRTVVITRPAGTASAMAREVRAAGGVPVLLPGLSLRMIDDAHTRAGLADALTAPVLIFGSAAAVRFAAAMHALPAAATVLAVGQATARALRRHGVAAPGVPARQDSEGLLAMPQLQAVRGRRVALIGAAGGRDLLPGRLAARGAQVQEVHVYRRLPPRLDRRHDAALRQLPSSACVLWSSVEALHQLHRLLPADLWARLCGLTAVVSSERVQHAARSAGFRQVEQACSALSVDLLAAAARVS
jgi:uroporphyrinogen-III synthase